MKSLTEDKEMFFAIASGAFN